MTITINGSGTVTGANTLTNTNTVTSAAATALTLQSAGTTAVTIDTSQNVGVGTASPGARLELTKSSAVVLRLNDLSTNYWDIENNSNLVFSRGGTERARIDISGNLLVGTTSTLGGGSKFNVSQSTASQFTAYFTNTNASGAYGVGINSQTGENIYLYYQGAYKGLVSTTAGGTTYGTTSDYRLKENIQPMTGAIDKVALLKPCTYTWKEDGLFGQGFIAHELQAVVPEAVVGEKDAVETYTDKDGNEATRPKYQGIDTSFLVATLTAAIQEQQALITSLTTRLTALENK
jgi:hypothetical protein